MCVGGEAVGNRAVVEVGPAHSIDGQMEAERRKSVGALGNEGPIQALPLTLCDSSDFPQGTSGSPESGTRSVLSL